MMQMDTAEDLRLEWERMGNPPCSHPHIDREYYLAQPTGEFVCKTCGETHSSIEEF